jgi:predicted O-methyltransferase YrrM
MRTALKRGADVLGFDLVRQHFYSPIPDWRRVPEAAWTRPSPLRGVRWDLDAQLAALEDLAQWLAEFSAPRAAPDGDVAYHYDNGFFSGVDADVLHAMIRRHRPRRVVELGSGFSSLVIAGALARNRADGHDGCHDVFDPYARPDLQDAIRRGSELHLVSATDVAEEVFTSLGPGDVLFVDTTHTVKLASDVNAIVLDVLPLLQPGVLVHFHDVFLPYEYPRAWFEELEVYWAEQYLLQAFLAFNDAWEVVLGVHALVRERPERVRALVPGFAAGRHPGSFWLRRSA